MRWSWVPLLLTGCLSSPDFFGGAGGGGASGGGSGSVGPVPGLRLGFGFGAVFDAGTPAPGNAGPPTSHSSTVSSTALVGVAINPDLTTLTVLGANGARSFDLFLQGAVPSSIAGDARSDSAYVTLRLTGRLLRVDNVSTAPVVAWDISVCSEPTGVALSPTGAIAVVACFGESAAVLVDTRTQGTRLLALPGAARAVAISNNGDGSDLDEHAYLPLFYGVPSSEGTDTGRTGLVVELSLLGQVTRTLSIAPIADTGYWPVLADGGFGGNVGCVPNQLAAIALVEHFAVVPFTCASPAPPATPTSTLFSAVALLDVAGGVETGAPIIFGPNVGPVSRMAGLVDVDIWPDKNAVVVLAQGADTVAQLAITPSGFDFIAIMPLASVGGPCSYPNPCMGPPDVGSTLGVPVSVYAMAGGFVVNDWTGRSLIGRGPAPSLTPYAPRVAPGSDEQRQLTGRRLFYTALDRWSRDEVGSCASCHPDGLSDNLTWMFSAGPRQTPGLDGTFSKRNPADHRAQNWTANFDEIYDVEGVVRNVLGGRGALVDFGENPLPLGVGVMFPGAYTRNDGLSGSARFYDDDYSAIHDWAPIEGFIQGIRSNRASFHLDAAAAARGRALFEAGGCPLCHAGDKWTVSRVPYQPTPTRNGSLPGDNGMPAGTSGLRTELRDGGTWPPFNLDTYKVAVESVPNPDGGAPRHIGPERITCVLRDVRTYDPADPLERKPDGSPAQGALGFNVPSLLGLATSAPYFHNGSARTLADVFDPRFGAHTRAGNPAFFPSPQELADLVVFLQSIDGMTPAFDVQQDLCGGY